MRDDSVLSFLVLVAVADEDAGVCHCPSLGVGDGAFSIQNVAPCGKEFISPIEGLTLDGASRFILGTCSPPNNSIRFPFNPIRQ